MKRKYEREFKESESLQVFEKIKIGVMGSGRGVGTSFVATSIAVQWAAQREKAVAFVELFDEERGKSWIYDIVGMDKRFGSRKYESLYNKIKHGRYIRGLTNMDMGVNWAVPGPEDRVSGLTGVQESRLINNISGDVIVCDLGFEFKEEIIADMDVIVCVVDPKPSKLIASRKLYQQIKQEQINGRKIIWVINKVNGGINKRCFRDYIKIKDAFEIPIIKDIHFYAAEYNCRIPIEQREIKKATGKIIEYIVKETVL